MEFCFTCGHGSDYHEQNFNLVNGDLVLGRCLCPVGYKHKMLGLKYIDVCPCKLFLDKELIREVQLPEK